jgi:endonuclease YncB( thermonuclease family)
MKFFLILFLYFFVFPVFSEKITGPYDFELTEVVDGDTYRGNVIIWINTFKVATVRLSGVDTPELNGKCDREKELAKKAKEYVEKLFAGADKIKISSIRPDKYGDRVLANVIFTVNGQDKNLAKELKSVGLAVDYQGKTKTHDWCKKPSFLGLF